VVALGLGSKNAELSVIKYCFQKLFISNKHAQA